jgi:hypothetical protein
MVSFTPRPLYFQGNSPWYPLDRRLGGLQKILYQISIHLYEIWRSSVIIHYYFPKGLLASWISFPVCLSVSLSLSVSTNSPALFWSLSPSPLPKDRWNFFHCFPFNLQVPFTIINVSPVSFYVNGVPCLHGMACPQVADGGDGLEMWRVAANILHKQSRRADWRSYSLRVWRGGY